MKTDFQRLNYKISIITINFNNAEGLRETIKSVFSQSFHAFEYIIIDGSSRDESSEVIDFFADISPGIYIAKVLEEIKKNPITYWISEPDNGIYHAMNKGLLKAQGEYCLFLNSGDFLTTNKVLEFFSNEMFSGEDIISGYVSVYSGKNKKNLSA